MKIGNIDIGWKTIAGFCVYGLGLAMSDTFPDWFPFVGVDWIAIAGLVKGFGAALAGIGVRHAISKIGK